jgi:hypothetical protein
MKAVLRVLCALLSVYLGYQFFFAFSFANGMKSFNSGSSSTSPLEALIWIHWIGLVLGLAFFAAFGGKRKKNTDSDVD